MTLQEMDDNLAASEARAAAAQEEAQKWLRGRNGSNEIMSINTHSLPCRSNSHGSCQWAECKCYCHENNWGM
jgi:hypothetical protein